MGRFAQGKYSLKNPEKYIGTKTPTYRSSWEFTFMKFCDEHPSVAKWASEAIKIPYRKTRSYLDIAKAINKPSAVIAVANAIGKNPLLFFITCHRVIGSNGKLTGFAAGLRLKKLLLKLENTHF